MRPGGRDEISGLQSRASFFAATHGARGSGRGSSLFFPEPDGEETGPERLRASLQLRRPAGLSPGVAGGGVAVRLRAGGDLVAAAGAARPRRPGVPRSGGRSAARPLDAERISAAAPAGDQRSVHAGAGGGARRGSGTPGDVAIDSTRVAANASRNRLESEDALRRERTKLRRQVRRWQQQCDATDPNETPGAVIDPQAQQAVEARLAEIPRRLGKLGKAGLRKRALAAPPSR